METTKLYTDMDTGTEFKDNDGLSNTASFHDIRYRHQLCEISFLAFSHWYKGS